MHTFAPRAGRWTLALTIGALVILEALAAAADESAPPAASPLVLAPPDTAAGDVITVTSASGGTERGSLRWALRRSTGQKIIRFDPALTGATITLDSTLNVARYVTIEGPKEGGITLSGGGVRRVMYVAEGAHLKNLTITDGSDPVFGAGIHSYGPLLIENVALHANKAGNAAGIYAEQVTLINSTITENTADALASGISYDMEAGLTLINTTVARNGPAPGIRGHGNPSGKAPVYLKNAIIAGNGAPPNNCWFPAETFIRIGTNIADDLTCGNATQMVIQKRERDAFTEATREDVPSLAVRRVGTHFGTAARPTLPRATYPTVPVPFAECRISRLHRSPCCSRKRVRGIPPLSRTCSR
jgi:hypothetical protein